MARNESKQPTPAELEILGVLWERGPSTVRTVYHVLSEVREIGYTTVLKLMQIMTDKRLVSRDARVRPQIYTAAKSERVTQRQLVSDLRDRVFGGSSGNLVLQALSSKKTTPEEREAIRELLDQLEKEGR